MFTLQWYRIIMGSFWIVCGHQSDTTNLIKEKQIVYCDLP